MREQQYGDVYNCGKYDGVILKSGLVWTFNSDESREDILDYAMHGEDYFAVS